MAKEAKASPNKAGAPKRRVIEGQSMVCEVCGLSVVVEEVGGIVASEEATLLCCGRPMKKHTTHAKTKRAR